MGKSKAAIRDLSKVVELKQDFTSVSNAGFVESGFLQGKIKSCFVSKNILFLAHSIKKKTF